MTGREGVFVVVSGAPGSGKTTLARPLAQSLDLPLISNDVIKERLFDGLGVDDLEWSRRLGRASVKVLFPLAADVGAAVLDNAWSSEHSPADLAGLGAPLVEVFCDCPVELAASRFEARLALWSQSTRPVRSTPPEWRTWSGPNRAGRVGGGPRAAQPHRARRPRPPR